MSDAPTALAYRAPSRLAVDGGGTELRLATTAEPPSAAPRSPLFFDGFLAHGEQSAAAILLVSKVARTRFYTPPGMLAALLAKADPVITANVDRLRFESFSACGGVAARYDVLPAGLDGRISTTGTTNVDVNPPLRAALSGVRGLDPIHLAVGTDVTVTTLDARVVEPKVPLPDRWVRGFAEAQAAAASLVPRAALTPALARRFIRSLPASSGSRTVAYAVESRDGLRLASRPAPGAIPLGGPARLRVLEPLLGFATSLTAYGPADAGQGVSVWQLDLADARLSIALSPSSMRGFSGEGGLLLELADEQAARHAETIGGLLCFEPVVDVAQLVRQTGLSETQVRAALAHLAAAGRVGFDAAEGAYFHRELPWLRERTSVLNPRLEGARRLLADGAVELTGTRALVRSGDATHVVRIAEDDELTCTCPWYAQHGSTRGPCKHALAVHLQRAQHLGAATSEGAN